MLIEILLLFIVAVLYSSTGHGGGSGYIAILILMGLAPAEVAPIALTLNLLVATLALLAFHKAGGAAPRLLLPLAVCSVPLAYVGGRLDIPDTAVAYIVAPALAIAAALLVFRPTPRAREVGWMPLALAGAVLGFVAGVTGIGGGIYLTPILLMAGWADKNKAAWTSAGFIIVNSLAGLAARAPELDAGTILPYILPVILGGALGSTLGAFRFSPLGFRRIMAGILALAGLKAFMGA